MALPSQGLVLWGPSGVYQDYTGMATKAATGWLGGVNPDAPYVETMNSVLNNISDWLRWVKDEKTKEISNTADVIDIGVTSATAVNIGNAGAITTIAGTTVATLTEPTIASFANATHAHTNAASGGLIDHVSLSNKGTLTHDTIDSYLDQAVKVASSPTFNAVNVTAAYTPRVDTGTATSLQIGTTNATGILIGKLGIATALQGTINVGTNEATDGVITIGNPTAEVHIVAGSFFAPSPVGLTSVNVDGGTGADAPILFNENLVNKYRLAYIATDDSFQLQNSIGTPLIKSDSVGNIVVSAIQTDDLITSKPFRDARNYASLSAAVTAIADNRTTLLISEDYDANGVIIIPETLSLSFLNGGRLTGSGTVTIRSKIEAPASQIFGANLTIHFENRGCIDVLPHWFYNPSSTPYFHLAINAAIAAGALSIYLPQGNYQIADYVKVETTGYGQQGVIIYGDGPDKTFIDVVAGGFVFDGNKTSQTIYVNTVHQQHFSGLKNMTITGPGILGAVTTAVYLRAVFFSEFSSLYIKGFSSYGFYVDGLITDPGTTSPDDFDGSGNNQFNDIFIIDVGDTGFDNRQNRCSQFVFNNVTFDGCGSYCFRGGGANYAFNNCVAVRSGDVTVPEIAGFKIQKLNSFGVVGVGNPRNRNFTFSNCEFESTGLTAVALDYCYGASFNNCSFQPYFKTFTNLDYYSVRLGDGADPCEGVFVNGLHVSEPNTTFGTGTEYAVRVGANGKNVQIQNIVATNPTVPYSIATQATLIKTDGVERNSAAPSAGARAQGEVVWNAVPVSGSPIGWVCVSAGSPGTWLPFGQAGNAGILDTNAQTFTGAKTFGDGILTDSIGEETTNAGVGIDGALIKDGGISLAAGSVSAPKITVGTDTTTGFFSKSANRWAFTANGIEVLNNTVNGGWNIGATTTGVEGATISNQAGETLTLVKANNTCRIKFTGSSGNDMYFGQESSTVVRLWQNNGTTPTMSWRQNGQVEIDTTTESTSTTSGSFVVKGGVGIVGRLNVGTVYAHADNAAAVTAGLAVGSLYRTGDILKIVHS